MRRSVDHCQFAFHLRREQVCINPYHYNKVSAGVQQLCNDSRCKDSRCITRAGM